VKYVGATVPNSPFISKSAVEDLSVNLIARWRDGDQQAAAELFQRYALRLIGLVRQNLSSRLAARLDPEDVIQSVYNSFFTGARDGRYILEHIGDLWRLLVAIALHKLHGQVQHHSAGKRAVAAEQHDDSFHGLVQELRDREPSPEEATALSDLVEQLMREFDAPRRRVLELRLQGYGIEEVAAATGYCRHTVRRLLNRARRSLEELCPELNPGPP
jgi:RNA polymerase sigma-70 factor (ECF subfamily)